MSADINAIDLDGQEGSMMSGVFRWKKSHQLRSLPTIRKKFEINLDYSKGWMELFRSRCNTESQFRELVTFVQQDLSLIDCLSFPSTVMSALLKSGLIVLNGDGVERGMMEDLHIVCLGCSSKAEERVLRETACWGEIGLALRHTVKHVHLYLIGPEMTCTESKVSSPVPAEYNMTSHTFKGTAAGFFKANKMLLPMPTNTAANGLGLVQKSINTVAVGLNCGFGNYENPGLNKYDLIISWYADLAFLVSIQHLPMIFTCANDYADLDGECYLHGNLLGSLFLCEPQRSAFSCASTFVSGNVSEASLSQGARPDEFSCGNSFWYCVQGSDSARKRRFPDGTFKLPVNLSSNVEQRHNVMRAVLERPKSGGVPIEACMGAPITLRSNALRWLMVNLLQMQKTCVPESPVVPVPKKTDFHDEPNKDQERENEIEIAIEKEHALNRRDVPVVESAQPDVQIQQSLDSVAKTLTVAFTGNGSHTVAHLDGLEAHVDTSGVQLLVDGFALTDVKTASYKVTLLCAVDPASVSAKVSKKKRSLTVVAAIAS